jgi:hypothetical protein
MARSFTARGQDLWLEGMGPEQGPPAGLPQAVSFPSRRMVSALSMNPEYCLLWEPIQEKGASWCRQVPQGTD